jgi:hypothetical protein
MHRAKVDGLFIEFKNLALTLDGKAPPKRNYFWARIF